jgi:hypothetical protein
MRADGYVRVRGLGAVAAHGDSFLHALASAAARQPGLLKAHVALAVNQQQLADITRELRDLGQRLLSASSITQSAEVVGTIAETETKG